MERRRRGSVGGAGDGDGDGGGEGCSGMAVDGYRWLSMSVNFCQCLRDTRQWGGGGDGGWPGLGLETQVQSRRRGGMAKFRILSSKAGSGGGGGVEGRNGLDWTGLDWIGLD
ncbi:unnamed protein product [Diplocarpon coronariae]